MVSALDPAPELDPIATELVVLYRRAVRVAPAEAAAAAALILGRALEAIQRAKRSLHRENAYEIAMANIADARRAMERLNAP